MKFRAGALLLACAALAACTPELDWRELSVPEGRFAVLLPCKARHEARPLNTASGEFTMTMYACSLQQGTLAVAYTDYPPAALALDNGRAQLDAARDALLRNIQGKVIAQADVAVAGLPGRKIDAEGRAGANHARLKARFVLSGNRLYQIAYVGAGEGIAVADIDLFLGSFKLLR